MESSSSDFECPAQLPYLGEAYSIPKVVPNVDFQTTPLISKKIGSDILFWLSCDKL